jgi:MoxR-like ATPase
VFTNLLLADEINRAPAKVQSALLEVMQEQAGHHRPGDPPVPRPVPGDGHPEPDRVRGHYPLPEAQVDRFMMKVRRRLPERDRGVRVVERALARPR